MTDAHGDGNSSLTFESASFGDGVGIVIDAVAAAVPFLPGGVGAVRAGAKAAVKADDVVDAARGADASKNVFKNRVKLRKETKEKIRKNAARDVDGRYIDPNTGISNGENIRVVPRIKIRPDKRL